MGLASCLAVVTLALALTGRLALYIAPSSNWFAVSMAVLLLVGAVASFALPLGAEEDHGHDHDHDHEDRRHPVAGAASVAGGVIASGVALTILLVPPASLSAEIATTRDVGSAPLFAGADLVSLATHGDTTQFGVGDWASVFATATNPDAFEGDAVTLTGFVTPAKSSGSFELTRLVITHCVIDAQVATLPVTTTTGFPGNGRWVSITGTVRTASDGTLEIDATHVKAIPEPRDPYEY
ncbi:TIGR03943 family putative permease subunit [Microbacterium deminutum]|uniref:TIGR03943 family putative permease subunit n=1 Tax=Microbacterium deminutum TaxID=344164 RepID=UPI0031E02765